MKYSSAALVIPLSGMTLLSNFDHQEFDINYVNTAVQIRSYEMPSSPQENEHQQEFDVVNIYSFLKKEFNVSNTKMAEWLGMKRRSLYNWLKNPDSSTRNLAIENRLKALNDLAQEMEPEHRAYLEKISTSPIYGDPNFSADILSGQDAQKLKAWYDRLFDNFESYRQNSMNNVT